MKTKLLIFLLIAAVAQGANLINVAAYKTTDGACDAGIDSTIILANWNLAPALYFNVNATGTGCFDTVLTVDSVADYSVVIKWYEAGVQIGADNQRATSWAASMTDSVYAAISDANKANFKNGTGDSVTVDRTSLSIVAGNFANGAITAAVIADGAIDSNTFAADAKVRPVNVTQIAGTANAADSLEDMLTGTARTITVNVNAPYLQGNQWNLHSAVTSPFQIYDSSAYAATSGGIYVYSQSNTGINVEGGYHGMLLQSASSGTGKYPLFLNDRATIKYGIYVQNGKLTPASVGSVDGLADTVRDAIGDTLNAVGGAVFLAQGGLNTDSTWTNTRTEVYSHPTAAEVWGYDSTAFATADMGALLAYRILRPVIPGNALDVTGTGGAGIDWSNVESKTSTVALSATTVGTATTLGTTGLDAVADAVWDEDSTAAHYTSPNMALTVSRTAASQLDSGIVARIGKRMWGVAAESGSDSTTVAQRTVAVTLAAGDISDIAAATASAVGTSILYPLVGPSFLIDAAGTNSRTQFVVDTASLGEGSSSWETLRNRQYILRNMGTNTVQIPLTLHSVAYTAANCTLTVADSMPFAFAANDTIQMTGFVAYEYETVSGMTDSTRDALGDTLTGVKYDILTDGVFLSTAGNKSVGDTLRDALHDSVGTRVGIDSIPRSADLMDSTRLLHMAIRKVDTTGVSQSALTVGSVDITSIDGNATAATQLARVFTDSAGDKVHMYMIGDSIKGVGSSSSSGSCAGDGSNSVTMYARDTLNNARVSGVMITMTSGVTQYWGQTGLTGSVAFSLDDGTWVATGTDGIRSYVPKSVVVDGTEIDSVNGGGLTVLTPADASLCATYGTFSFAEYAKIKFTLEPLNAAIVDTSVTPRVGYVNYVRDTVLNSSGYISINLPKTDNLIYYSGDKQLHPVWRVQVTKTDYNNVAWDKKFSIDSDSTTIDFVRVAK